MKVMWAILSQFQLLIDKMRNVYIGDVLGFDLDFSLYDIFFDVAVVASALALFRSFGFEGDIDDDLTLSDSDEFDEDD